MEIATNPLKGILTHNRGPGDNLAREFVKTNYPALLEIVLKMVNHHNLFAKREALKLLNALLRDEYLKDVMQSFVSSVVFLQKGRGGRKKRQQAKLDRNILNW